MVDPPPKATRPRVAWWRRVAGAGVVILLAVLFLPPLVALNVRTAWTRARLRRAIRRAWPTAVRVLVRDDSMQWSLMLREEWLPLYAPVTILVPPAELDSAASAEVRLARRVFDEWGSWHKRWGPPVAVIVAPGREPLPVLVTQGNGIAVQTDGERLRFRLDALVAAGRSRISDHHSRGAPAP